MPFQQLGLAVPIQQAVKESGYTEPTPIQVAAIPVILQRHDLMGIAQTGTGKDGCVRSSFAFAHGGESTPTSRDPWPDHGSHPGTGRSGRGKHP